MTESEKTARLEKLAKRLRAGAGVLMDAALEVEAILEDKATPGQQAKAFLDGWCKSWAGRYPGQKYHVDGAKDMAQIKRVMKTFALEDLVARSERFLTSRDPFYTNARHPLPMFLKAVNKFGATGAADVTDEEFLTAPPADCQHRPACKSDEAHTARVMREMRQ